MIDNKQYYDSFSSTYDDERHDGYHALIDDLEIKAVRSFCEGKLVLEAGCGSGLVLDRLKRIARQVIGMDLSFGMLGNARKRSLNVAQANILHLPFPSNTFDTVVSFKVLAHIELIQDALRELARVTKPGGMLALEFYNPVSMRGLIKRLKPPSKTSDRFVDEDILTRYDSLSRIRSYLPEDVDFEGYRGVRIVTPSAGVHKLPIIKNMFRAMELAMVNSFFAQFAGFLIVLARKKEV